MFPYWDDFSGMRHIGLPIHGDTRMEKLSQEDRMEKRQIFQSIQEFRQTEGLKALLDLGKKAGFTDFQTLNMLEGQKVPMSDWRKMQKALTSKAMPATRTKERKRA